MRTEKYFRERGWRADRKKTLRILSRAGKGNSPRAGDELPSELAKIAKRTRKRRKKAG